MFCSLVILSKLLAKPTIYKNFSFRIAHSKTISKYKEILLILNSEIYNLAENKNIVYSKMDLNSVKRTSSATKLSIVSSARKSQPFGKLVHQGSGKSLMKESIISFQPHQHFQSINYNEFEKVKMKHDKIALLENEIQGIQNRLSEFYFKIKEILLKDYALNRELKLTFFGDHLKDQISQCDSITLIDFLQKIIFASIDFSHNIGENTNSSPPIMHNESDYVIILQRLEEEIVLFKQKQLEDEFIIFSLKAKVEELQEQNLKIVEKSTQTAQSFKQDFYKLLTIIHELEYDISHYKNIISEKDENIQKLTEKNFSIYVLEHKIKSLEQKYKKDFSKAKNKFANEVNFIKDTRISDPNFYNRMHSIDQKMKNLENKLYNAELKNQKLEEIQKNQKTEVIEEKSSFEKTINQMNKEIFDLREKLAEKNKEIIYLKNEMIKKNELIELNSRSGKEISKVISNHPVKVTKSLNNTIFNKTWAK